MAVRVLRGHCVEVMKRLPPRSCHVCVTSPPYWQARRYGTHPQIWGGAWLGELGQEPTPEAYIADLLEVFRAAREVLRDDATLWINLGDSFFTNPGGGAHSGAARVSQKSLAAQGEQGRARKVTQHDYLRTGDLCQIPTRFAEAMQRDGWTLRQTNYWIKKSPMPESLDGTHFEPHRTKVQGPDWQKWETALADEMVRTGGDRALAGANVRKRRDREGWQVWVWEDCAGCPKCAANDGLILRWDSGRPTSATEYVFLFTKGQPYFYNLEATRQPTAPSTIGRMAQNVAGQWGSQYRYNVQGLSGAPVHPVGDPSAGRNLWNWWMLSNRGTAGREDHYASYPADLPRICLEAGTSERGVCPHCGRQWAPVVERDARRLDADRRQAQRALELASEAGLMDEHLAAIRACGATDVGRARATQVGTDKNDARVQAMAHEAKQALGGYYREFLLARPRVIDWRPTCACPPHEPVPATALDPFCGSGTTLLVADRMGRNAIGIDLNQDYAAMTARRVQRDAPLLAEVEAEDVGATAA